MRIAFPNAAVAPVNEEPLALVAGFGLQFEYKLRNCKL